MNAKILKKLISALIGDIEFDYKGIHGAVCPINHKTIYLSYDDYAVDAASVDDAMSIQFIDGKSLNDVSEQLEFYQEYDLEDL